jgi:hypothetical protein
MKLPSLVKYSVVGLAAVAVVVTVIWFSNRSSQVRLQGQALKVRTLATDENSSLAVVEFRIKNPADVPFVVRVCKLRVVTKDGSPVDGEVTAEMDLDRVLDYYKTMGPRFNPTIKTKDRIGGRETIDRTVAGSFPVSESALQSRQKFVLELEDVDGAVETMEEVRR